MMRSLRCAGWVVMALLAANGVGLQADHMAGGQGGGGGGPGGGGQGGGGGGSGKMGGGGGQCDKQECWLGPRSVRQRPRAPGDDRQGGRQIHF